MNIDILDDEIFTDIASNLGLDAGDEAAYERIAKMTPEEAWERFCVWNGLLGSFHYTLKEAFENIFQEADDSIVLHYGKSPCGHSEQFAFTEDGGKNIVCLECEYKRKVRFQLLAIGRRDWIDGTWTSASKKVFCTREEAEAYKLEFRKTLTTPEYEKDLRVMIDDGSLQINVVELELV